MLSKSLRASVLGAACLAASSAMAFAEDSLTITTFGGAFENAAAKAWFEPYTAKSGTAIAKEQYDGGLAKLQKLPARSLAVHSCSLLLWFGNL